jgi:hypothetical protein
MEARRDSEAPLENGVITCSNNKRRKYSIKRNSPRNINKQTVTVCSHNVIQYTCGKCWKIDPSFALGLCKHRNVKSSCKACIIEENRSDKYGVLVCEHNKLRRVCKQCFIKNRKLAGGLCPHGGQAYQCVSCYDENSTKAGGICEHRTRRRTCKECFDIDPKLTPGLCEHKHDRYRCFDCFKIDPKLTRQLCPLHAIDRRFCRQKGRECANKGIKRRLTNIEKYARNNSRADEQNDEQNDEQIDNQMYNIDNYLANFEKNNELINDIDMRSIDELIKSWICD